MTPLILFSYVTHEELLDFLFHNLTNTQVINGQMTSVITQTSSSGATGGRDLKLVQSLKVSLSAKVDESRTIAGIPQGGCISADAVSTVIEAFNENIQARAKCSSFLESGN